MKPTEFRIGNYITAKGVTNEIIGIRPRTDNTEEYLILTKQGIGDLEFFKPIPLTEEWLLKFGFEKLPSFGYNYFERKFEINFTGHTMQKERSITVNENCTHCFTDGTFAAEIKHVHQLQNLYFALTGEELTLKEKAPIPA